MKDISKELKLYNGIQIPSVGFGTWQIDDGKEVYNAVSEALKAGYRHIDTASVYGNESGVGQAVKSSGISRDKIFITSKLWNDARGYDNTLRAFDESLSKLGTDYLDLYLIHWPAAKGSVEEWNETNLSTWRAFEKLYKDGRIKAIGVSNFMKHHLTPLMAKAEIMPMVNQIEFHPGKMQKEALDFCRENDMLVEAWSPLGGGIMFTSAFLSEIADSYDKSIAQICIRWCLQNGVLPLPKSATPDRIKANMDVFDFNIDDDDMEDINNMPYFGGLGLDPDKVTF